MLTEHWRQDWEIQGEMGPVGWRKAELTAFPVHKIRGDRMRERKSENCLDKCVAASRVQSFKLNRTDSHLLLIKISRCCYCFWLQINIVECNDSSVFPLVKWPVLIYIPWEISLKWGGTWTSYFTGKYKLSSGVVFRYCSNSCQWAKGWSLR